MKKILITIEKNKPITARQYTKIKNHINLNKKKVEEVFEIEKVNNSIYLFINNNQLFQDIFHSHLIEHSSQRVRAANLGFSHNARCSQSFLIVKKTPENDIEVVITPTETNITKQRRNYLKAWPLTQRICNS